MKILNTLHLPSSMTTLESLALYNSFDCMSVLEIAPQLSALLTPTKRATYEFEMELAAPLLEMEFNGITVDVFEKERLIREHEAELVKINEILHSLCEAIGYYQRYITIARHEFSSASDIPVDELPLSWEDWVSRPVSWRRWVKQQAPNELPAYHKALKAFALPFNGRSSDQKKRLFYDFFGHYDNTVSKELSPSFPPPFNKSHGISEVKSRDANNEYTPSADRAALEKIQSRFTGDLRDAATLAAPFVSLCLEASDIGKTLDFLRCKLEKGLFRASFACATETGRLSSRANSQGYGGNAQNISPRLRTILTCKQGDKLITIDYGQIESRCVAARCFIQFGATNYLNAVNCGDLHSLAASLVWEDLPWPTDFTIEWLNKHGPFPKDMLKAAKTLANAPFYRGKSRRDVSKTLGHGSSYMGKPAHMSKQSHIELGLVQHYQSVFFSVFPEIRKWHRWVVEQVQTVGEITTFLGRTRQFFGRPTDDSTIREAVAFEPQSTAADYTNSALLRIYKEMVAGKLPITILAQKHDELIFSARESDIDLVVPRLAELMEQRIQIASPTGAQYDWFVGTDPEVGWNLGRRKVTKEGQVVNPDGLVGWPDTRVRETNPFDFFTRAL